MCIYTLKKSKQIIIKNSPKVVRDSTERPKIRQLRGVKDTAKINKD